MVGQAFLGRFLVRKIAAGRRPRRLIESSRQATLPRQPERVRVPVLAVQGLVHHRGGLPAREAHLVLAAPRDPLAAHVRCVGGVWVAGATPLPEGGGRAVLNGVGEEGRGVVDARGQGPRGREGVVPVGLCAVRGQREERRGRSGRGRGETVGGVAGLRAREFQGGQ